MYQDWNFLVWAAETIKPEYFEDASLIWFYQTIVNYYREYNKKANYTVVSQELKKAVRGGRVKEQEIRSYSEVISSFEDFIEAEDYIKDEVLTFCKNQAFKLALLEMSEFVNNPEDDEKLGESREVLEKALNVGSIFKEGMHYFADFEERLRLRDTEEDKIIMPTGIVDLDLMLGGGLEQEQLCIWVGGTGVGKSLALAHCGKRAVMQKSNVIHYTLELSITKIAERYDASWGDIPYDQLKEYESVKKLSKKLGGLRLCYGDSLIIRQFPAGEATVDTVKADLIQLINSGFRPDLVIVDYLDLLSPTSSYSNMYEDFKVTTTKLRGLSTKFKVPIHTASQVNREGNKNDTEVLSLSHISDSMQKAFVADAVIAICISPEERRKNVARIIPIKNRNGPQDRPVVITTAYDRGSFYYEGRKRVPAAQGADPSVLKSSDKEKRKFKEVDFPVKDLNE